MDPSQPQRRNEVWWANSLILENVFKRLALRDLKSVSQVCSIWHYESAKLISECSYVFFLDIPARSIEQYLKDQQEVHVFDGPILHKRFEFLWERHICHWILQPSAAYLGHQMTELTITQGTAVDVNTLLSRMCQVLPNLKSLELRCSHSALANSHGIEISRYNSDTDDIAQGLVHQNLELLMLEISEHCGIKWDFLRVLVGLKKLNIKLFETHRDQEALIVQQIHSVRANLESRIESVAFDTFDVILPVPATRATSSALSDLLNLLQPKTYALDLHSSGYNHFPMPIIQSLLEPPTSVTRFELELTIRFSFEYDSPNIVQVFEVAHTKTEAEASRLGRTVTHQRAGFLFRLNLNYGHDCTAFGEHTCVNSAANRFLEIETGCGQQSPITFVRLGRGLRVDKDYSVLDWTQTLLANTNPGHNFCGMFRLAEDSPQVIETKEYHYNDSSAKEKRRPYKLFHLWTQMQPEGSGSGTVAKDKLIGDSNRKLKLIPAKRWREQYQKLTNRSAFGCSHAKYVFVLSTSNVDL